MPAEQNKPPRFFNWQLVHDLFASPRRGALWFDIRNWYNWEEDTASPIAGVRIIDGECLGKIRSELWGYARAIDALSEMPNADQLKGFFAQSSFTREKIVVTFTKAFKRK